MSERVWRRLRWFPAAALGLVGVLASTAASWSRGPSGCLTFMSDFDSVQQIGRSWFPPQVACRFTLGDAGWVEHQSAWGHYVPIAILLGAVFCAWFAKDHPTAKLPVTWPRWRHVTGIVAYWTLTFTTLAGLLAMAWRDDTHLAALPLFSIPVLSVWSLRWIWTTTAWPRAASG